MKHTSNYTYLYTYTYIRTDVSAYLISDSHEFNSYLNSNITSFQEPYAHTYIYIHIHRKGLVVSLIPISIYIIISRVIVMNTYTHARSCVGVSTTCIHIYIYI